MLDTSRSSLHPSSSSVTAFAVRGQAVAWPAFTVRGAIEAVASPAVLYAVRERELVETRRPRIAPLRPRAIEHLGPHLFNRESPAAAVSGSRVIEDE